MDSIMFPVGLLAFTVPLRQTLLNNTTTIFFFFSKWMQENSLKVKQFLCILFLLRYSEMIEEKQNKILQLNKELEDQSAKLDRATKMNSKYSRETRSAQKVKEELPEEVGSSL